MENWSCCTGQRTLREQRVFEGMSLTSMSQLWWEWPVCSSEWSDLTGDSAKGQNKDHFCPYSFSPGIQEMESLRELPHPELLCHRYSFSTY